MKIVMIGKPGSGKGTHGERLAAELGIPHISTGEMLRTGGAFSAAARTLIEQGELLPDDLMIRLTEERLDTFDARGGWLLDGFPRTKSQAQWLLDNHPDAAVLYLDVARDILLGRILARGRADDTEEVFNTRMAGFTKETWPAVELLREKAPYCRTIVGGGPLEETHDAIRAAVGLIGDESVPAPLG